MVSKMAIGSEVFGSQAGEIDVSVEVENSEVWLCCGLKNLRFILGRQSGSISAVDVGDGARHWMPFWCLRGRLKQ